MKRFGVWLAMVAGGEATGLVEPLLGQGWAAAVLARAVLLLACAALCFTAGWGLERTLKALHLGWLDRLVGAGLAGCAALLLVALLVLTGARFSPAFAEICGRSLLPPHLLGLVRSVAAAGVPEPAGSQPGTEAPAGSASPTPQPEVEAAEAPAT
jgi:uncharacterized membrane protein required for colicin V production